MCGQRVLEAPANSPTVELGDEDRFRLIQSDDVWPTYLAERSDSSVLRRSRAPFLLCAAIQTAHSLDCRVMSDLCVELILLERIRQVGKAPFAYPNTLVAGGPKHFGC